jgi:hypothetical protein
MNPFDFSKRHKKIIEIDRITNADHSKDINYKDDYLDNNSINLDLSENIYRIFNFDYFLNDFKQNTLTLVRPSKWDDPFENFLLNAEGELEDGRTVSFESLRNSYYAQCWSLNDECDGLWRNYKGKKEFAIKVRTNAKKLFNELYDFSDEFHTLNYFIGQVEYVSDKDIIDFFENKVDFFNYQSGVELAQTMLIKRKSFSYEKEVRIIAKNSSTNSDQFSINTTFNNWIDEIIFDPWVNIDLFEEKKQELIDAGYIGKISRSGLYDKPLFRAKI